MMRTVAYIALILFFIAPVYARPGDKEITDGLALFYQERWDDAIPHFEGALQRNPQSTLALCYILHAYYKKQDFSTILKELERRAEGENAIARAHLGLGEFLKGYFQSDVPDGAVFLLNSAVERDPQLSIGYCGLGMIYFQKGMIPRSKDYFLKALSLDPGDVLALELIGNILLVDEKNPEQALSQFQKITALHPTYPDGHYYAGSTLFDLDRAEEAVGPLELAIELDPKGLTSGADAAALLGDVYLKLGQPAKAREFKERARVLWGHEVSIPKRWDWVEPPQTDDVRRERL